MRTERITIVATGLLVIGLLGSVFFLRQADKLRANATLDDVLFVTSPQAVKRMSLGYDGLMAAIYWTRAVQYFGRGLQESTGSYKLLAPLLDITTTLDPKLLVAYQFGGNFLSPKPPLGAAMPEEGIRLIEKGIQNIPDNWKLYYELGFIYYMELKDYKKAADAFERGSRLPNAHPVLQIMASRMAEHAGDPEMARAIWLTAYQSSQDKKIKGNAVAHLRALKVNDDVRKIQNAVTAYGTKTGVLPPNMNALVSAGFLPGIMTDPEGQPYKLTPEGRVLVADPENFPFIEEGLAPGKASAAPKDLERLVH